MVPPGMLLDHLSQEGRQVWKTADIGGQAKLSGRFAGAHRSHRSAQHLDERRRLPAFRLTHESPGDLQASAWVQEERFGSMLVDALEAGGEGFVV